MWLPSNIYDNPSIAPFRTRTHVTTIVLAYQGTCTGVNFGEIGDLWWMIANSPIWRLWDKWCDTKIALWLPHCEIQSVLNHISLNKVGKLLEIPLPPRTTNIRSLIQPQKMAPWSLPQTSYWNTWFQNLTLPSMPGTSDSSHSSDSGPNARCDKFLEW